MKVYEIISESNELVNESLKGSIGKMLFGKGKEFDNVANELSRMVHPETGKLPITDPYVQSLVKKYGNKIVKSAEKKAGKVRDAANSRLFDERFAEIKTSLDQFGTLLKNIGWAYIVGKPFYDYNSEINKGMEAVESGEWGADKNAAYQKFEVYRKQRMAVLITKVTEQIFYYMSIGAGVKVASSIGNKLTFGMIAKLPGAQNLSFMKKLGTAAAQGYFMNSLNSKEGAAALAQLVVSPILGTKFTMTDTIGSVGTKVIDFLNKKADEVLGMQIPGTVANPTVTQQATPSGTSAQQPTQDTAKTADDTGYVSSLEPMNWDKYMQNYNKGN